MGIVIRKSCISKIRFFDITLVSRAQTGLQSSTLHNELAQIVKTLRTTCQRIACCRLWGSTSSPELPHVLDPGLQYDSHNYVYDRYPTKMK
jgi:hypothetical protein